MGYKLAVLVAAVLAALSSNSLAAGHRPPALNTVEAQPANAPPAEDTAGQIGRLVLLDQAARFAIMDQFTKPKHEWDTAEIAKLKAKIAKIDAESTDVVRPLVQTRAWLKPSFSAVTRDNIWLLVQHSPDAALQRLALAQIEPLALAGKFDGQDYGLLYDRVTLASGKPQRYGTQMVCRNGSYAPAELEKPDTVEARRSHLGFPQTYDDYVRDWAKQRC